jgi:hypothetical protein
MARNENLGRGPSPADFVRMGPQWNREWLEGPGAEHWLAAAWRCVHRSSRLFAETSCEVTAAVVRWKLGLEDPWVRLEAPSFAAARAAADLFQVSFGEIPEVCEHVVTVWGGFALHSFFGRHAARSFPLDEEFGRAVDAVGEPGQFERVARAPASAARFPAPAARLEATYWVPANARPPTTARADAIGDDRM